VAKRSKYIKVGIYLKTDNYYQLFQALPYGFRKTFVEKLINDFLCGCKNNESMYARVVEFVAGRGKIKYESPQQINTKGKLEQLKRGW
jgi:hypothetical protein